MEPREVDKFFTLNFEQKKKGYSRKHDDFAPKKVIMTPEQFSVMSTVLPELKCKDLTTQCVI